MHRYFLVLALALALGACGGDREEATDVAGASKEADAAVPVAPADVVAAEPVAAPAVPASLPEWFPGDVYLPADHEVAEVIESGGAHAVELQTDGEVFDLAEQARAAMLAAGWTENHYSPLDTRGGASMHYRKGERSATLAMAWGGNGRVRVMYNFATVPR